MRRTHRASARRNRRFVAWLTAGACVATAALTLAGPTSPAAAVTEENPEFRVNRADLEFILRQIKISESHARAGNQLLCENPLHDEGGTCVPSPMLPWGLRTVDGSSNNLRPDQAAFGAGGQVFPRLVEANYGDADPQLDLDGPGPMGGEPTSYEQTSGYVTDADPRIISNLIVDQTVTNPAAVAAMEETTARGFDAYQWDHDTDPVTPDRIYISNVSPDEGLSAPFSSWFTIFGQFFDHGLDLVGKGGSGTVLVPLQPDDPLYDPTPGARTNFISLTRATNQAGEDGVVGTADDVREHTNRITPFIDQNQTYTSHPSHQTFIREYEPTPNGPVPTGLLLDDATAGGLVTWDGIQQQSRDLLGIELDDLDVGDVPLLATDPYGRFIAGPNGFPQLVVLDEFNEPTLLEGDPEDPVDASLAVKAGHAFLDDIAHTASPFPSRPGQVLTADDNDVVDDVPTMPSGLYDDELLGAHYITGDGRGNENIGLTAVHFVFHAEHNRLVDHIDDVLRESGNADLLAAYQQDRLASGGWDYGERLFQAARFVTEMEYQHLAFEEFARTVQPTIDNQPLNETAYHHDINPAVSAEFAHVVYRFGHSMLTDTLERSGTYDDYTPADLSLLDGFLNPLAFTDNGAMSPEQGAASVILGLSQQTGNGIDEFVDDTLRNELLGLPLDLATINLARGRDTGMPTLQQARTQFYAETLDANLQPYDSWEDFRLSMKHRGSILNFVAAYGNDPSVIDATTIEAKREAAAVLVADPAFMNAPAAQTGLDDVDFWIGGLAEDGMVFGGLLGSSFNYVFEQHLEALQNADRFYYLTRTQGLNLIHQLENNSFSELVLRNTDADNLHADIFANPDIVIDLEADPTTWPEELLVQNGPRYRYDGAEHVVIHATAGNDDVAGGDGDDSVWGHEGDDVVEGGMGNDVLHGGHGDDTITDAFGDDTIHAGSGNDRVNAGSGLDLIFGGTGVDFILHGNEITQSFAGGQADFVRGGNANDILTGNEDTDWLEGAGGHDLLQGDNAFTLMTDPNGGDEVLDGGSGNDDHDAEGGDDIMLNNGIDRHAGMLGFDWVTHQRDPFAGESDLDVSVFQPLEVQYMRSRFMNVEGLSGWDKPDVLRGRSAAGDPTYPDGSGHVLTQEHIDQVGGLRELLGGGTVPPYATSLLATNEANDIILGGANSDLIEGRAGDDYIDGNAALEVLLRHVTTGEEQPSMTGFQARVFSGVIDPEDLEIVRRIVTPTGQGDIIDTSIYGDVRANYLITRNGDGTWRVEHLDTDSPVSTGVDTVRGIERLQFTDGTFNLANISNLAAYGTINLSPLDADQGDQIVATPAFTDPQGINAATIVYTWQSAPVPMDGGADEDGDWAAIATAADATTFTPTEAEIGRRIRVVATFLDGTGALETIASPATLPVGNVNDAPTGLVIDNTAPHAGDVLTANVPSDLDGTTTAVFRHQWQVGDEPSFTNIPGATGSTFTATDAQAGRRLRVVVTYTDDRGTAEMAVSAATAAVVGTPPPPAPPLANEFVGLAAPFRALDTRSTAGEVPSGSITAVNVTTAGVPSDARAVSLNVTATGTTGAGFVTVYPCDAPQPNTSNLNFVAGQTIANAVLAKPSAAGTICLFNSVGSELIVDVGGYLPAGFAYDAITPVRLLDTRSGAVVPANTVTSVPVTGANGVAANAKAAALNVTAVNAGAQGYLTVFPCGEGQPTASSVNFVTGQTIPGAVLATIGQNGAVCIFNSAPTHLLVDLAGSFAADAAYTALTPTRVLDTRQPVSVPVAAGTSVEVSLAGVTPGARAAALTVTAAEAQADGYLTVHACGTLPNASNLNYTAGQAIANTAITALSPTGSVCVFSSAATHVIIDVSGAF